MISPEAVFHDILTGDGEGVQPLILFQLFPDLCRRAAGDVRDHVAAQGIVGFGCKFGILLLQLFF